MVLVSFSPPFSLYYSIKNVDFLFNKINFRRLNYFSNSSL